MVQGDWTVACEGKRYQLDRQHEAMSLVRCKVIVRMRRKGGVQLVHRGKQLKWRRLAKGTPRKACAVKKKPEARPPQKKSVPAADHPWRGAGAGRKFRDRILARGEMLRAAARLGGGGSSVSLRYAPASLRPAPPDVENEDQATKVTFSHELNRGDF